VLPSARIRTFWRSTPANKQAAEAWLVANGIQTPMAEFLRAPAQEAERQRMIQELRIP
jgi:hypothetical protein